MFWKKNKYIEPFAILIYENYLEGVFNLDKDFNWIPYKYLKNRTRVREFIYQVKKYNSFNKQNIDLKKYWIKINYNTKEKDVAIIILDSNNFKIYFEKNYDRMKTGL